MTQPDATTAPQPQSPAGFVARFRENVRMVKALRRLNDDDLATGGGYRSRQVLNARLGDRTTPDLDDVARIAAALQVAPEIMFLPVSQVMDWIEQNTDYVAPEMTLSERVRVNKPAPEPAPAKKAVPAKKAPARRPTRTATAGGE